ncbi:MAG: hypothetical protein WCG25_00250 [bacterium]
MESHSNSTSFIGVFSHSRLLMISFLVPYRCHEYLAYSINSSLSIAFWKSSLVINRYLLPFTSQGLISLVEYDGL